MEEKEVEVLQDLAVALKLFAPPPNELVTTPMSTTPTPLSIDQQFGNSAIVDNNNGVITTQCRSISPLIGSNSLKSNNLLIGQVSNSSYLSSATSSLTNQVLLNDHVNGNQWRDGSQWRDATNMNITKSSDFSRSN